MPPTCDLRNGQPTGQGFTLLELLVAASIIALLAGLLIPAVSVVRASADKSSCKSNLRQYGMAALAYASDNEGFVPQIAQYVPSVADNFIHAYGNWAWTTCYQYGMERANQSSCPTVRRLNNVQPSSTTSSYNYNEVLGGSKNLFPTGNGSEMWVQSLSLSSMRATSELLLFSETYLVFGTTQNSNWFGHRNLRDVDPNGAGNYDHCSIIHNTSQVNTVGIAGVSNYVAADGHVDSVLFVQQPVITRWPGTRVNP